MLASACLSGGRLKEEIQPEVLHALGFMGYAEVRDVLWAAARDGDYHQQKEAALGLLSLPCVGLEKEIEAAIRECVGRNLFPEFMPVLAHKTGNPELLQVIFDMGRTTASTDCNGGIVYGIALFDEVGFPYFDQLLFDPQWEVYACGTGTVWWAYHGFRHLGGRLAEIASRLRTWHPTMPFDAWEYRVRTWLDLAVCGLEDPLPPVRGESYLREPAASIYSAAFEWSTPNNDNSLTGLTRPDGWLKPPKVRDFSVRLADRIAYEVIQSGVSASQL